MATEQSSAAKDPKLDEAQKLLEQLTSEYSEIKKEHAKPTVPAGKTYYKLIDTDGMEKAIMQDDALYDKKKERFTRKGQRHLDALNSIKTAQDKGYRFIPTDDNDKFVVIDPTGNAMKSTDSPVRGATNIDKGVLSLINKNSIARKAVSSVVGNAINNNAYYEDPAYKEAQKEHDAYWDRESKLKAIEQRVEDLMLGTSVTQSNSADTSTGNNNDGSSSSGGGNNNDSDFNFWEDPLPDEEEIKEELEYTLADSAEAEFSPGFNMDLSSMDADDWLSVGATTALLTSQVTKGMPSKVAMATGVILDTWDAAIDEDRSLGRAIASNASLFASSFLNKKGNKKVYLKATRGLAKYANKYKKWGYIAATKIQSFLTYGGLPLSIGASGLELAKRLKYKYEHGEAYNVDDVADVLYFLTMASAGIVHSYSKSKGLNPYEKLPPRKKSSASSRNSKTSTSSTAAVPPSSITARTPKVNQSPTRPVRTTPNTVKTGKSTRSMSNKRSYELGGALYGMHPGKLTNTLLKFSNGGRLIPKAQNSGIVSTNPWGATEVAGLEGNSPYKDLYGSSTFNWNNSQSQSNTPSLNPNVSLGAKAPSPYGDLETEPAEVSYKLGSEKIEGLEGLSTFYKTKIPINWEDVKLNGADPSTEMMEVIIDPENSDYIISASGDKTLDEMFEEYVKDTYDYDPDSGKNQDNDIVKAPFFSASGAAWGTVPYSAITDSIANYLSYKNQNTVEWQPGIAPKYTPDLVFAAKSMPFEVKQNLVNQTLASSKAMENMSSDSMANQVNARRAYAGQRNALNKISMDEAQWNLRQIERQEDQERAAVGTLRSYRDLLNRFENQQLAEKIANNNKNAAIKTEATQRLIDNYALIAKGVFDQNIKRSEAIADVELEDRLYNLRLLEQEYDAILANENSTPAQRIAARKALLEARGNLAELERLRQAGSPIRPRAQYTTAPNNYRNSAQKDTVD